jgi:hypothetical protein
MASFENTTEAKTEKPKKEKMVKIRLPRDKKNPTLFVSVNDRNWLIKRGIDVEVPECVAEVMRNAERAQVEADEFEAQVVGTMEETAAKAGLR